MTTSLEQRANTLLDGNEWFGRIFTGSWVEGRGERVTTTEPATGEVLGEVGTADATDVREAARRARVAQVEWQRAGFAKRAAVLRLAARLLEENSEDLKTWLVREGGAVPVKAAIEVGAAVGEIHTAAALPYAPTGTLLPSEGRTSMLRRVPIGVVGVITPWNFPVVLGMRSIAPALALGNAVILKPDPNTPVCGGIALARLFERAGVPAGVFQVLPGGVATGSALVADPDVPMITFTGSTAAGRAIGETAGRLLKRVVLELGGNSPMIVLEDADLDRAASAGAFGSFLHQGQICMATSRHLVHESIAADYTARLAAKAQHLPVGDPHRENVALGPIINAKQLARISSIVDESVASGAIVAAGGAARGPFFAPTVLHGVTPAMRAFRDEIFGPVAPITTFRTIDEAIELANDTEYGLSAAVYTSSIGKGLEIADRIRSGMVHINDQTVSDDPWGPFVGIGASGNGHGFGAPFNHESFTQTRWVTLQDEPAGYPF